MLSITLAEYPSAQTRRDGIRRLHPSTIALGATASRHPRIHLRLGESMTLDQYEMHALG